ncbi:MAG TPA: glucose-6-phosphate isomerase, partial [Deltaproteobacteria bacterium]|nr:glucose-6-phosphate isomerase [Deltaproteobacteria bacterium]
MPNQKVSMNKTSSWYNFQQNFLELPEVGFSLDTSLMDVPDVPPNSEEKLFQSAFQQMQDLEDGGIANPDENRMVGHYWLRNPELAPSTEIQNLISSTIENIQQFSQKIQQKILVPQKADSFQNV